MRCYDNHGGWKAPNTNPEISCPSSQFARVWWEIQPCSWQCLTVGYRSKWKGPLLVRSCSRTRLRTQVLDWTLTSESPRTTWNQCPVWTVVVRLAKCKLNQLGFSPSGHTDYIRITYTLKDSRVRMDPLPGPCMENDPLPGQDDPENGFFLKKRKKGGNFEREFCVILTHFWVILTHVYSWPRVRSGPHRTRIRVNSDPVVLRTSQQKCSGTVMSR